MEQIASKVSQRSLVRAAIAVWRQEGWSGVAWRVRARLGWAGMRPRVKPSPPPRPDLLSIGARTLESFAAGIVLPAAPQPLVSVLVAAFDDVERTLCCLAGLARYPAAAPFEVLTVDDGSTDDSPRVLPLVVNLVNIRNDRTQGFVPSVNHAARAARGRFLLLLGNDAQVQPGWLDELVAAFDDPEVGIAGSKLIHPSGYLREAGAVLRSDGSIEPVGLHDDPRRPEYNVKRDVDHCSATSMMIPRGLFLELGGFDEAYAPSPFEDCDLSLRVHSRGRRVVNVPTSVVVHDPREMKPSLAADEAHIERNRRRLLERWGDVIARQERVRAIAFYLPQYHPIPENDAWWGEGFTDWTNVRLAKPLFPGHAQPRVPAELGYYDLRRREARAAQAELAARYGLAGFCYYYYWFNGKRLLERPLLETLEEKRPDFPFCVCWANENWTRRWDGRDDQILIAQEHSPGADRRFFEGLLPVLTDERYIRVGGRPLLLVYRPQLLPDVVRVTSTWRRVARGAGLGDLYLAAVESFDTRWDADPRLSGFDATVEFPPHGLAARMAPPAEFDRTRGRALFFDYAKSAERFAERPLPGHPLLRTAMPSWDNTPRRGENAHIFLNGSAEVYGRWLDAIVRQTRQLRFGDERIVFINAWNEWAEGNYLEPDQEKGHAYLEATARALTGVRPELRDAAPE